MITWKPGETHWTPEGIARRAIELAQAANDDIVVEYDDIKFWVYRSHVQYVVQDFHLARKERDERRNIAPAQQVEESDDQAEDNDHT